MKKGYIDIDDGEIYFEVSGDGFPIILIHGFGLDTRMWEKQVEKLSQVYQVVTYDMRGFGKSSLPISPYSHEEDLTKLFDYFSFEKANILGFSIGGKVALDFSLASRKLVHKFIIANGMPSGFDRKAMPVTSSKELLSLAKEKGIEIAKEELLNHQIFTYLRKDKELEHKLLEMFSDYSGWHWINSNPVYKTANPATARLSEIDFPTLIISSEFDSVDPGRAAIFLKENIANSKLVLFEETGHMTPMENPGKFNSIVLEFLDDNY